ncbi:hypothetical protein M9Y10_011509 [Tritrichomonas musculus]|uniref:Aminopeptidase n=1 Tax=Tritrichomonas musculus TaxID=1915356 RepID=A0ABR2IJJ4_9EUKA
MKFSFCLFATLSIVGFVVIISFGIAAFFTFPMPHYTFEQVDYNDDSSTSNSPFNYTSQKAKPVLYDVSIYPDVESQTFQGSCIIYFNIDSSEINSKSIASFLIENGIHLHLGSLVNLTRITFNLHSQSSENVYFSNFLRNETREELIIIFTNETNLNDRYIEPKQIKKYSLFNSQRKTNSKNRFNRKYKVDSDSLSYNFTISFEYVSKLSIDNEGLYGTFDTITGVKGVSTQFEATAARRAFPCVDTPSARSKFKLSLFAEGYETVAIANTDSELIEEIEFEGKKGRLFTFFTTPPLPPYLVAFAVGKWDKISGFLKGKDFIESLQGNGNNFEIGRSYLPVDIYCPVGQKNRAKFALKLAIDSINFFENYFRIPYPLPKLQLACIPDFAAGAMENWGLVTFRDTGLLALDCDEEEEGSDNEEINSNKCQKGEKRSSMSALSRVAEVVVHENSHMWAGDLVSPMSWSDLWLNEGFATLLPHICLQSIDSRFLPWSDLYHEVVQEAIEFDFSLFTHPIIVNIGSGDEEGESADTIFDSISYSKGGTVLNMLRQMLSEETFKECLCQYFKKFALKSASTEDLIHSFEETSGVMISSFLEKWTREPGCPTIKVTRNNEEQSFILRQERLVLDGSSFDNVVWTIPLVNLTLKTKSSSVTMNSKEMKISFNQVDCPHGFIEINPGRRSMAIVDYDDDIIESILSNWNSLSNGSKWMLLEDLRLLCLAKRKSISQLYRTLNTSCIQNDSDLDVIESALKIASFILSLFPSESSAINNLFKFSLSDYSTKLGSSATAIQESRIRKSKLSLLAFECHNEEAMNFLRSMDYESLDEEYQNLYMRLRGQNDFDFVYNEYKTNQNSQMKIAAVIGIGSTLIDNKIDYVFKNCLNGLVKTHEFATLLSALKNNEKARSKVADFVVDNFDKINSLFSDPSSIIEIAFNSVDDENQLKKLSNFFSDPKFSDYSLSIGRSNEFTRARLDIMKKRLY